MIKYAMYRCIRNDSSNKAYPERIRGRAGENRNARKGGWEPLCGLLVQEQGKVPRAQTECFWDDYRREGRRESPLCKKQKAYAKKPTVSQEGKERL